MVTVRQEGLSEIYFRAWLVEENLKTEIVRMDSAIIKPKEKSNEMFTDA
jgi:hypothetical protein